MNNFTRIVFGSCVGFAIALMAMVGIGFLLMVGLAGSGSGSTAKVEKNSVLHLTLNKPVPEQTNNLEMNPFDLSNKDILGLNDIERALEHAATDDKIKGVFLNLDSGLPTGITQAAALRKYLTEFKESGKFIVAYSKYYSQGAYYMSSVADKVYVNPLGGVDLHGFSATIPFFKEMLDKVGIKMQVFYAGDFKSATEPYRLTEMSDSNRLQLREYLEPVFNNFLSDIGKSRGKSVAELRAIADGLKLRTPKDAVELGLADEVGYLDDVLSDIRSRLEVDEDDKLNTISLEDYAGSFSPKRNKAKDKIAVVYAEGAIYHTDNERGTIVDNKYVKMLRKLRKDDKVKAIVLRVNSPGGSAIASENIWRELSLAKEDGKPVVVSMGNYAASGGYYISCMADKIYAEPNTLTGSIGVFQMIPNTYELFNDKLGISFDTVKTTKHSTGLNTYFEIAGEEDAFMRENTKTIYDIFLQRVADGRDMTPDEVHLIAKGRVWVGTKAKEIGLVDEIGDINDAIAAAAELAELEEYKTPEYPRQPEPMEEFLKELTGQSDDDAIRTSLLKKEFGEHYEMYQHIKDMMEMKGVQARLPVLIEFR